MLAGSRSRPSRISDTVPARQRESEREEGGIQNEREWVRERRRDQEGERESTSNACTFKTHGCEKASLSLSLHLSLSLPPSLSFSRLRALSLSRARALSLSCSLMCAHSRSLLPCSLSCSRPLALSRPLSHSRSLSGRVYLMSKKGSSKGSSKESRLIFRQSTLNPKP
jgi:hypothetical protein